MYVVGILCTLLVATSAEFCYNDVEKACSIGAEGGQFLPNCNAKYGGLDTLLPDLQAYANAHFEASFEFLLMSTSFGNFEANRGGLKGLYRKLSVKAWEDAIDVIKYIAIRGGKMNFNQQAHYKKIGKKGIVLELNELNSLARALDTEKQLANEALHIHVLAQHHTKQDSSVAHYIEEKFFEDQATCIHDLARHVNNLKSFLQVHEKGGEQGGTLSVFLFDEYLKKLL